VPFRKPYASTDNTTAALMKIIKAAASFRLSDIYKCFTNRLWQCYLKRSFCEFYFSLLRKKKMIFVFVENFLIYNDFL